jgi:hypothetical protein
VARRLDEVDLLLLVIAGERGGLLTESLTLAGRSTVDSAGRERVASRKCVRGRTCVRGRKRGRRGRYGLRRGGVGERRGRGGGSV